MPDKCVMFLEEITKWVDDGSSVDVIYLDFQKAFDKVPHQRLIRKLKSHGMGNSIINWIEQWLSNRQETKGGCGPRGFKLETSLEWGATRICTRADYIFGIHQ